MQLLSFTTEGRILPREVMVWWNSRIFIARNTYKYISLENCTPTQWNEEKFNNRYAELRQKYEDVLSAMKLLHANMDVATFCHYAGLETKETPKEDEVQKPAAPAPQPQMGMPCYVYPKGMDLGQGLMAPNFILHPSGVMQPLQMKDTRFDLERSFLDYMEERIKAEDIRFGCDDDFHRQLCREVSGFQY